MGFVQRQFQLMLLFLVFGSIIELSTSNPFDLFGLGGSDDTSQDNGVEGPSAKLDAAGAGSFGLDKSVHIPDPISGGNGLDANFDMAAAKSFSLSKSKGEDPVIPLPPPTTSTPRPIPPYSLPPPPPPPPPPPKPCAPAPNHGSYNVHNPGSRSGGGGHY